MKKIIILSIMFLLVIKGHSQNLTFADLKYLLEHDIEAADTYITAKNFEFLEAKESNYCSTISWSYGRIINNDKAQAFISKKCFQANSGFIWYQPPSKNIFENIKQYCKSNGYKLLKNEIDELGSYSSTYVGPKYNVIFSSGIHETSNKNVYSITLEIK